MNLEISSSDIKIDFTREGRQGFAEVIYGEGKSLKQLEEIFSLYLEKQHPVLFTRLQDDVAQVLSAKAQAGKVFLDDAKRTLAWYPEALPENFCDFEVALVSAGSSDQPVIDEAEMTLRHFGVKSYKVCDAGVAGIHRLLRHEEKLKSAAMCIVVAGMDGALPSVVGGLVGCPVVAVPTSVGYGASFGGVSALLSMLSSCASGLSVVNIDNGYGAAMAAVRLVKAMEAARQST